MKNKLYALIAGFVLAASAVYATDIELRPDHPTTYVVEKGDTLWDISAMFLNTPWLWPKLWQANPQIENPHLIYPGDELQLVWINNEPKVVKKREANTRIVKLGPKVRTSEPRSPIPTIPLNEILPFIKFEQVLDEEVIDQLPYIVGSNDRSKRLSAEQTLYAAGIESTQGDIYGIYRKGDPMYDPDSNDLLGYRSQLVGIGTSKPAGNFTRIELKDSKQEVRAGDKLIPILDNEDLPIFFRMREPNRPIKAKILYMPNESRYAGRLDVVAISMGENQGIEPGHMLAIFQPGAEVLDRNPDERPVYKEDADSLEKLKFKMGSDDSIRLPDERIGELMVFRVYDKISYGLIVRSDKPAARYDIVTNP